ncbi:bifunctional diguanylate cyclase/phosphodiesterase [Indiicoccus explosivorum]|uniref:bifunctional diguanylate cyclase/phosphodiesterase n=1 Tax=Indiicoccus explosivorum TaxID=1917864 RepID=UPI000B452EA5|nr:bifunctional diguanylate cyclase/phosphodiesterase [Indiicoccus explosivorum]
MSEWQELLSSNLVFNHIPFPIVITDKDGCVVWCSQHAERAFHIQLEDVKGEYFPFMRQEKAAQFKTSWEKILRSRHPVRFENVEVRLHDGSHTATTMVAKAFTSGSSRFVMTLFELDEFEESDTTLQELTSLRDGLSESFMMLYFDKDHLITYANPLFLKNSKWTPKRIIGRPVWQMFADTPEDRQFVENILNTLESGKTWTGEAKKMKKDGERYWVNLTAIPMLLPEDEKYYIFLARDITKIKQFQDHLEEVAFIDPVTGLENRHRLEQIVNEAIQEERHFSFVYLNIDQFYTLTDVSDADVENELLTEFTNRLRMYFSDTAITRTGIHEFALVTPLSDWFIEGFVHYLQQHPIYIRGSAIPLKISGSITRYPEDQQSFIHLMKASHATIDKVKSQGGGTISALSPHDHDRLNRKALIEKRLLHALDRNDLQVLYQPQVDILTGRITGAEALVRWRDEEAGIVSPDELIPIAEETGLIHDIGLFVLESVCRQMKDWASRGIQLHVSINSSVREFRDKDMARLVQEHLEQNGCSPNMLTMEITEKFALEAEAERSITRQMMLLQQSGVTFALDDFGTGYASFRYMQLLPISELKIDKQFIQALSQQEKMPKLVSGMIQFGKSMDFKVIAEGVETNEQFEVLRSLGCDVTQGYLSGHPVEASELERWLKSGE